MADERSEPGGVGRFGIWKGRGGSGGGAGRTSMMHAMQRSGTCAGAHGIAGGLPWLRLGRRRPPHPKGAAHGLRLATSALVDLVGVGPRLGSNFWFAPWAGGAIAVGEGSTMLALELSISSS